VQVLHPAPFMAQLPIEKKPYIADCGKKGCKVCLVVNDIKRKQFEEENK